MSSTLSRAIDSFPNGFDPGVLSTLPEHLQKTIRRRNQVLGPGYMLMYREPVEFVSGHGAHLFDHEGNDYLDVYNNVPCVGHAHPRVVEAVSRQLAAVNTNTRYVQEALVDYAERLLATFPDALSKLSLACSGSEANDLAMRVARFHTGGERIIALAGPTTASRAKSRASRRLWARVHRWDRTSGSLTLPTRGSSRPGPRWPSTCATRCVVRSTTSSATATGSRR